MSEVLQSITGLPTPFNMVVLIVLIGSVAGVISTIVTQCRKYACHRQELEFKRDLLDRGMSADDISRVVRARSPRSESASDEEGGLRLDLRVGEGVEPRSEAASAAEGK